MASLSARELRVLDRRLADMRDETRYLLVSRMGPRFALYYNVSDDVYVMNDPAGATLFRRRKAALAIKQSLGPRIRVVRCRTRLTGGQRVPILRKQGKRAGLRG